MMNSCIHSRRHFIRQAGGLAFASMTAPALLYNCQENRKQAVVSIVKIKNDDIDYAVEKAIDLLGGLSTVAKNKESIMLKPNLVAEFEHFTTKPSVVRALARLMKRAGKEVWIGEGSASGTGFNILDNKPYKTNKAALLNPMQEYVYHALGYDDLAASEKVRLVNLHEDDLVEISVPQPLAFSQLMLHRSLAEVDMLCSVPMMKTHVLATVTLGMKNLIGLYPGTAYCSIRSCVHDMAAEKGSSGVSFEIIDMVRANKLGLTVIDGSMAMEGNGPTDGDLVKMDLIIAGTNPLATDMVGASVMGIMPHEVPTFTTAMQVGMKPRSIDQIEIRGEKISEVQRKFARPNLYQWQEISPVYANEWI